MSSPTALTALNTLIERIERCRETQNQVDVLYSEFRDIITREMSEKIPTYDWSKRSRKRLRLHKPYWNDELTELWKRMREMEKQFLKCDSTNKSLKNTCRQRYKESRNTLDKRIRFYERKHKKQLAFNIESVCSHDPKQFWDQIKKLGSQRKTKFPTECYDTDGDVTSDLNTLKNTWKTDFCDLYNLERNDAFDDDFKLNAVMHKEHMERNMLDPLYVPNDVLNSQITEEEVQKAVMKTKSGKSCGIDELPYEVLKSNAVIKILHKMFMFYFDTGITPSIWRKAIICPLLKDPSSDPLLPLNYRGISLLSAVTKI
jgi:hypothetical protein